MDENNKCWSIPVGCCAWVYVCVCVYVYVSTHCGGTQQESVGYHVAKSTGSQPEMQELQDAGNEYEHGYGYTYILQYVHWEM